MLQGLPRGAASGRLAYELQVTATSCKRPTSEIKMSDVDAARATTGELQAVGRGELQGLHELPFLGAARGQCGCLQLPPPELQRASTCKGLRRSCTRYNDPASADYRRAAADASNATGEPPLMLPAPTSGVAPRMLPAPPVGGSPPMLLSQEGAAASTVVFSGDVVFNEDDLVSWIAASAQNGVLTGFVEYYPGLNFIHVKPRASRLAGRSWPGSARVNPAIHVDPTSFPDAPPTSRFFGSRASQQHRISSRGDARSPLAATPAAPLPRKQKVTALATPPSAPYAADSASAAAVDSVPAPAASEPDAAAAEVPADVGSFGRPSSRTWRLQTSRSPDGWSGRMRSIRSSASYSLHLPGHMTESISSFVRRVEKLCWVEVHRRQLLNMMHGSVGAAER
ncbi:uncharacterized protein LOC124656481 [Lolium rigidum]|uniref:uncharacterized protein LOC124656481 n=1 Tax=Lolium rigidum TaxID=89674 RepID=UPI001F5C11F6|nr:uncharacterized protein LOC124656481 [Lolium rigidum]